MSDATATLVLDQYGSPGRKVVLPVWQIVCVEDKGPGVCSVHWACGATKGVSTVQGTAEAVGAQVEAGLRAYVGLLLSELALGDAAHSLLGGIGSRAAAAVRRELGGMMDDPEAYIRDQITRRLEALAAGDEPGDDHATQKAAPKDRAKKGTTKKE